MGFADQASSVLRNNRRLQKSLRKKWPIFSHAKESSSVKSLPNLNNFSSAKAKKRKLRSIVKLLLFVLVSSAGALIVFQQFVPPAISEYRDSYYDNIKSLKADVLEQEKIDYYNYLVGNGTVDYEAKNLTQARNNFQKALSFKPNGKRANIGLIKCLLTLCLTEKTFCTDAEEYYKLMISEGYLSNIEFEELTQMRNSL